MKVETTVRLRQDEMVSLIQEAINNAPEANGGKASVVGFAVQEGDFVIRLEVDIGGDETAAGPGAEGSGDGGRPGPAVKPTKPAKKPTGKRK